MTERIVLAPYTREYLERSWAWLNDPEIKRLTMTPDFSPDDQAAFFDGLPDRSDYRIWGVASDGEPIGAAGIKNIGGTSGEVFLYVGERAWWGRGIGSEILHLCEREARALGLDRLTAVISSANGRSVRAFEKAGYAIDGGGSAADIVRMTKSLP
jgi:RimJ/RimL family protein N-acetyltransferase